MKLLIVALLLLSACATDEFQDCIDTCVKKGYKTEDATWQSIEDSKPVSICRCAGDLN